MDFSESVLKCFLCIAAHYCYASVYDAQSQELSLNDLPHVSFTICNPEFKRDDDGGNTRFIKCIQR